jgi:hypothetical protein
MKDLCQEKKEGNKEEIPLSLVLLCWDRACIDWRYLLGGCETLSVLIPVRWIGALGARWWINE